MAVCELAVRSIGQLAAAEDRRSARREGRDFRYGEFRRAVFHRETHAYALAAASGPTTCRPCEDRARTPRRELKFSGDGQ